jgi:hypothetical protein
MGSEDYSFLRYLLFNLVFRVEITKIPASNGALDMRRISSKKVSLFFSLDKHCESLLFSVLCPASVENDIGAQQFDNECVYVQYFAVYYPCVIYIFAAKILSRVFPPVALAAFDKKISKHSIYERTNQRARSLKEGSTFPVAERNNLRNTIRSTCYGFFCDGAKKPAGLEKSQTPGKKVCGNAAMRLQE